MFHIRGKVNYCLNLKLTNHSKIKYLWVQGQNKRELYFKGSYIFIIYRNLYYDKRLRIQLLGSDRKIFGSTY